MQEKVELTIRRYDLIRPGQTVLAGVSGGPDSVALLTVLLRLSGPMGFALCAAHLNHGIRGESADRDEAFVRELCEFYGVPFLAEKADVPRLAKESGQTLETAGRNLRYDFLERARRQFRADCIAVAHHMDDQAESVLLHLSRGSGLSGLGGMQPKRGRLIRPFLHLRRQEIEDYLAAAEIAYCVDATNLETGGTRNRLRLHVMPYLAEHINPAIVPTLCSMAELLRRDEAYLALQAEEALEKARRSGGYDRRELAALPAPILTRALRIALRHAGAAADIERVHVEQVVEFLTARTGARLALPHVEAWISYDLICFGVTEAAPEFCIPLNRSGFTHTPLGSFEAALVEGNAFTREPDVAYMDYNKLPEQLFVRTRKKGDRFYPLGAPGMRKLKDYFIDRKVPREQRVLPLIAAEEILFIPGFGISERVRVEESTKKMLRLKYRDVKLYEKTES